MPTKLVNSSSAAAIDKFNLAAPRFRPEAYEFGRENVKSTIQPDLNALSPNMI